MARVLHAPDRLTAAQKRVTTTLYLAGPFEDDAADTDRSPSWRDEVIDAFADLDIVVIDPRNERWPQLEPGAAGRRGAYDWQCDAAFDADVVLVWVPAGSRSPTALLILGYLGAKRSNPKKGSSVLVGGGGADGLVQLFAQNQRLFPCGEDLTEVIRLARLQVEQAIDAKASS